jgi:glutaredoxin
MSNYMIFGKRDCPHTQKALADYKKELKSFMFIDVDNNPRGMEQLLEYSNGKHIVPVIVNVDEGNVEIGYTGD